MFAQVSGRQVLLVERFDRRISAAGWERRMMVSALTILRLDEMQARYASYGDLADIVRKDFSQPRQTLRELFGRMAFGLDDARMKMEERRRDLYEAGSRGDLPWEDIPVLYVLGHYGSGF